VYAGQIAVSDFRSKMARSIFIQ